MVLWLFSPTGFGQTDGALVQQVEAAGDPQVLDRIAAQLPAVPATIAALRDRADALFQTAEFEKARRLDQAAMEVAIRANDPAQAARAFRALGLCYRRLGRQQDSLDANQAGLNYSQSAGDKAVSAELWRGVGLAQRALGRIAAAIDAYQRSIAFCGEAGDRECALRSIANLGGVYSEQGDYRRAAEVLQSGLAEASRLHSSVELGLLNNLGRVYASQGDPTTARAYFDRELELARAQNAKADLAMALTNSIPADPGAALRVIDDAMRLAAETDQPKLTASLLLRLADIEEARGRTAEALADLTAGLRKFQEQGQRGYAALSLAAIAALHARTGHDAEALEFAAQAQAEARACGSVEALWQALSAAGRAYRHSGRREDARAAFEEQVSLGEAARRLLADNAAPAHPFFDPTADPHYALMEIAVGEGRIEEALQALEGAKARLLLDVLENGHSDPAKSMTDDERREEQRLAAQVDSNTPAALRGDSAGRARWDAAQRDLTAFRAGLWVAHPELRLRRAAFVPFGLGDAATLLPDSRTALVEFALSGDRIYAFVLTRDGAGKVALAVSSSEWKAAEASAQVEDFRRCLSERSLAYREPAAALYRRIFAPIAGQLQGKTVVGIVPDGVLWGGALQASIQPNGRFFLEDHAVFYAPSLTALREMRRRRPAPGTTGAKLLAFGASSSAQLASGLAPLPESRIEVSRVAALYGKGGSDTYLGSAARKGLWTEQAPRYQILHVAAHGVLNTNNPLYSYFVLSDGVIEAREILDLDLHAQLAVLSACETGLGSVFSGEGLIGMSWAFLVAGVPTAVVSQWRVDSAGTGELMVAFHRAYRTAGFTAARALQRAALDTMKTPSFSHPFYWAGFVLTGAGY